MPLVKFSNKMKKKLARNMRQRGMKLREIAARLGMSRQWAGVICEDVIRGSFERKCTELVPQKRKPHLKCLRLKDLNKLGLEINDFHQIGVNRAKAKARKTFRQLILNPTISNDELRVLIETHQSIQAIKFMPRKLDMEDLITLLEVQKGFKSTEDIDFGLNDFTQNPI